MHVDGIPTLLFSFQVRDSTVALQTALARAQKELADGRYADIGLQLGGDVGRNIAWRAEIDRMRHQSDLNRLAGERVKVVQQVMTAIREAAEGFMRTLAGARGARDGQELVRNAARTAMDQLAGLLNTVYDGRYLFAGTNSQQPPLRDFDGGPASAAIDAAFTAAFGIGQDDPEVSTITAAQVSDFIDDEFAALFLPAEWVASWSAASDQVMQARIDRTQMVAAGTSANVEPFRKLAAAYAAASSLGEGMLSGSAFEAVVDKALALAGGAILGLGAEQSQLGLVQGQIAAATERLGLRLASVESLVRDAEAVDPYEAATRVNALMTQLEASYTITGRIGRLSLLNFL
jgi:flagellar hook-associated protein 3 FlgL